MKRPRPLVISVALLEFLASLKSAMARAIPDTPPAMVPRALNPLRIGITAGRNPPVMFGTLSTLEFPKTLFPLISFFAARKASLLSELTVLSLAFFIPFLAAEIIL
uniref:Uncharacterized protein n=1 Tax=Cacopsylla melanoneura TaxID=428564 RepID=A0A8D8Z2N4_9HEMI